LHNAGAVLVLANSARLLRHGQSSKPEPVKLVSEVVDA